MSADEGGPELDKAFYATVGELVILSTSLDAMLNTLLIEMYQFGNSAWLEAIIGTLDTARKIEILKAQARAISYAKVAKSIKEFMLKVEAVTKQRNIVCHTPPTYENGSWGFRPTTAAKILHPGNIYKSTMIQESLNNLKASISTGHAALQIGSEIIEYYKRMNAEQVEYYKRLNSNKSRQK